MGDAKLQLHSGRRPLQPISIMRQNVAAECYCARTERKSRYHFISLRASFAFLSPFFCLATSKCRAFAAQFLPHDYGTYCGDIGLVSVAVFKSSIFQRHGYKCMFAHSYTYVVHTCMVHSVKSTFRAARRCSAMLHAIMLRSCALHLSTFPALHPRVIQVRRLITGLLRH